MQVLTKSLQLHPRSAGLWSYAASWEFEHNKNTTVARNLMQQGLRVCKGDQQLWLDYLRMELVYAQKLSTRRQILGITPGTTILQLCAWPKTMSDSGKLHEIPHDHAALTALI